MMKMTTKFRSSPTINTLRSLPATLLPPKATALSLRPAMWARMAYSHSFRLEFDFGFQRTIVLTEQFHLKFVWKGKEVGDESGTKVDCRTFGRRKGRTIAKRKPRT